MLIPEKISANVINKKVIYKDEILPVKQEGNKMKITKINNINLNDLENCIKAILLSNSSIIFFTVQYSNKEKTVYFYSHGPVSTKAWEDLKENKKKILFSSEDVALEIKNILDGPQDNDEKKVNLYDLTHFMKRKLYEYEESKRTFQDRLNRIFKARHGINNYITVYDFDYGSMQMSIGINDDKVVFVKDGSDLRIIDSKSVYSDTVVNIMGKELYELYDFFMKNKDYVKNSNYGITSTNSCFLVDAGYYGVTISTRYADNQKMFKLSAPSYTKGYTHYMYSPFIDAVLGNSESELFKRIYVKIADCPKWCLEELYNERLLQLENEQKYEEETILRRKKIQRKDEIKRKLFPFIKK